MAQLRQPRVCRRPLKAACAYPHHRHNHHHQGEEEQGGILSPWWWCIYLLVCILVYAIWYIPLYFGGISLRFGLVICFQQISPLLVSTFWRLARFC